MKRIQNRENYHNKKIKLEFSLPNEIIALIIEFSARNESILTGLSLVNHQFHSIIYDSNYGLWDHLAVKFPFQIKPPNLSIIRKIYFKDDLDDIEMKFDRVNEFIFNDKDSIDLIISSINSEQISKITFYGEIMPNLFNHLLNHFTNTKELVLNDFAFHEWDEGFAFDFKKQMNLESFVFTEVSEEHSGCYSEPSDASLFVDVFAKYSFPNIQKIWFEIYYSSLELCYFVDVIKQIKSLQYVKVSLALWNLDPLQSYPILPPNIKDFQLNCAFTSFAEFLSAYFNHPNITINYYTSEHLVGEPEFNNLSTDQLIDRLISDNSRRVELKSLISEKKSLCRMNCLDWIVL